jgi:hypothetical protein
MAVVMLRRARQLAGEAAAADPTSTRGRCRARVCAVDLRGQGAVNLDGLGYRLAKVGWPRSTPTGLAQNSRIRMIRT